VDKLKLFYTRFYCNRELAYRRIFETFGRIISPRNSTSLKVDPFLWMTSVSLLRNTLRVSSKRTEIVFLMFLSGERDGFVERDYTREVNI